MKIQIIRCKGGWYFRFKARNGRILCHSEVYISEQSCVKGASSVVGSIHSNQYKWERK